MTEWASYNEGGRCEPMVTPTGKRIVGDQFLRRAQEVPEVRTLATPKDFGDFFEKALAKETGEILGYACVVDRLDRA